MDNYQIVAQHCQGTIEHLMSLVDQASPGLERACELMVGTLLADRKIICCGSGADGALAQLFSCNMLGQFEQERPALPVIALGADGAGVTAITNAGGSDEVFSRPLRALGQPGDILLCLCSNPVAPDIAAAILAAQERNMPVILLSNAGNAGLVSLMNNDDVTITVAQSRRSHIIEMQTLLLNCLCELIEHSLFGSLHQE
jgi:phosphoheptose isomerase